MEQTFFSTILFSFMQIGTILLVAPLIAGVIRKIKAFMQNRRGTDIIQQYRDIYKLFQKEAVISRTASWITPITPYILFASTLGAAMLVPLFAAPMPFGELGDILVMIYLLALGSFFLALAGLDQGSAFGGMGSSRHMTISSLAEPAIVLAIFSTGIVASSANISKIIQAGSAQEFFLNPVYIFSFLALFIAMLAETGRIPVDNPATHLELTMIHEAMILDYSGRHLAFIEWASAIKLLLFLTLISNIFFPFGIATGFSLLAIIPALAIYIIKIIFFAAIIALIESLIAKFRLFRAPDLLWIAFMFAMLGIIIHFAS